METKLMRVLVALGVPGVALGVFYLLLRQFHFQFEIIPAKWTVLIVLIFLLLVGGITIYALHHWRPVKSNTNTQPKNKIHDFSHQPYNIEKTICEYIKILRKKCNTLSGLDIGPRFTLDKIYLSREFQSNSESNFITSQSIKENLRGFLYLWAYSSLSGLHVL